VGDVLKYNDIKSALFFSFLYLTYCDYFYLIAFYFGGIEDITGGIIGERSCLKISCVCWCMPVTSAKK
jgi:hypothetical protein